MATAAATPGPATRVPSSARRWGRTPPSAEHTRRTGTGLLGAGLLVVALAGCSQAGDQPGAANTPTTSAATASTAAPRASATPTRAGAGPTAASVAPSTRAPAPAGTKEHGTAAAIPRSCSTAELTLRPGQTQGAAGSIYTTLLLHNDGPQTCTLAGFPGVSLLDPTGHQLGPAAARDGTAAGPVTLRSGQRAAFVVRLVVASCTGAPPRSTRIRVFPPDQRAALTLPFAEPVCATPTVTAVRPERSTG